MFEGLDVVLDVLEVVEACSGGGAKLRGVSLGCYPSHDTPGGYIDCGSDTFSV